MFGVNETGMGLVDVVEQAELICTLPIVTDGRDLSHSI